MRKLGIEYYENKCIGNGSCASIAPDYFELSGKKATLKNSKNVDKDTYTVELNCDEDTAENLIKSANSCPVNAIRIIDMEKNEDLVDVKVKEDKIKEVTSKYDDAKEFVIDAKGYFLIKIDRENKNIVVAFCNEKNKIVLKVTGKKPIDIYQTIINKEKLPIRKDHAAYLGRELQKAYLALKYNLQYVQDDELDLNKKVS
ncbi:MAG: DUF4346 domain-containing protein [Candidatus Woesearchaeota archaeon]|jgi:ferredoxin|nr:DUF4346 domain-containing protein [Candidatus Woesearchaeota archaeon]